MTTTVDGDSRRSGRVAGVAPQVANDLHLFLRNKRAEWLDYRHQVTPFELNRYLPVL
jgi:hypothetical protein